MAYQLLVKPRAEKEIRKLPAKNRRRILRVLTGLQLDPYVGKKLEGEYAGCYSVRVWPYRIIYCILRQQLVIVVIRVAHRQGVYK